MTEANFQTIDKLDEFARKHGHPLLELAVGWLATQPEISSVISGATSPEQVTENAKAVTLAADAGRDGGGQQDNEEIASMMRDRGATARCSAVGRGQGICGTGRRRESFPYPPRAASLEERLLRSLSSENGQVDAAAPRPPDHSATGRRRRSAAPATGLSERPTPRSGTPPLRRTIWPDVGPAKCVPITLIGLSQ